MRRETEKNHFQIDKNLHFMNTEIIEHTPQQKAPAQTKPKKIGCKLRCAGTQYSSQWRARQSLLRQGTIRLSTGEGTTIIATEVPVPFVTFKRKFNYAFHFCRGIMAIQIKIITETDFNMLKKSPLICLAFAVTLSACGGGGTSSTDPVIEPPPPTGADFSESPYDYAVSGLDTIDSMIQLGHLTNNLISQPKGTTVGVKQICQNGGEAIAAYSSDSFDLNDGEIISFEFNDCFRFELDGVLSGTLQIEIVGVDTDKGAMSYIATLNSLEAEDDYGSIYLAGIYSIQSSQTKEASSFSISVSDPLSISQDGDLEILIDDLEIGHVRDWLTAQYSVTGYGEFLESNAIDAFQFRIDEPVTGYFSEYPNEGQVTLTSDVSTDLVITANFVTDSALFNVAFADETGLVDWASAVSGAMWSVDTAIHYSGYAANHRVDNFNYLGVNAIAQDTSNFPINESVEFYFSRPISTINAYNTQFTTFLSANNNVDLAFEVVGSKVIMTPLSPLTPGEEYTFHGFEAFDELGQSIDTGYLNVFASTDALADIESTILFAQRDIESSVSVSAIFANSGAFAEVTWSEVSDYGVVFSDEKSVEIYLDVSSVPADVNDVVIMAEVKSDNGLIAYASKRILIAPESENILGFVSEEGDWVGGGESVIYGSNDGTFTAETYSSNSIKLRFDSSYYSDYWTLNIQAPEGSDIEQGRYDNATRWPFQASLVAGFDFSGNHRGCNTLASDFEVLEIEFSNGQLTKLAVDFTQYCEGRQSPPLTGVERFNSSVDI